MAKGKSGTTAVGRSKQRSVNERHFERAGRVKSSRHARKPVIDGSGDGIAGVTYPGKLANGGDLLLPAEAINKAPLLAAELAAAFTVALRSNRPREILRRYWSHLGEFAVFMGEKHADVTLEMLSRHHLMGFRDDLDERVANGITRRSKTTRAVIILTVQAILRKTGRCDHVDFIKRPYVSVGGKNLRATSRKPRRRVPRADESAQLLRAALTEMEATMTLRAAFLDDEHPALADPGIRALVELAHRIRSEYGCRLPDGRTLESFAKVRGRMTASLKRAVSAYMPTRATIAPFCIVLMMALRLDGHMLADLRHENVTVDESLGVPRLRAAAWRNKVRVWKTLTAATSRHWHSPEKLIAFIDEWSTEMREIATPAIAALQFSVASLGAGRGVVRLEAKQGIGRAVTDFCARNGLARITSSIPRKIAIDLVDMLSSGDVVTRAQAGQHSVDVNFDAYDTPEAAARGDDAYGVGMMLISAHRQDRGRVPDKRTYLPDEDVLAATPGWWCSNPFDPPAASGQSRSRPCAAYGWCPVCPNGEPHLDDPVSCKRVGLLLEAIMRSEPNMPPETWEGTWKPLADELAFKYIPMFDALPEVTAAAALLDIGPMMEVVNAQHI